MFVTGRVVDPDGKPVPNATTMVYASLKWPGRGDRLAPMWPSPFGRAKSDGSGRFRLEAPRVSSARHYDFGAVAIAPGYGAGWVKLDPDADRPDAAIRLRPEQIIHGRVFDVQGRPVRDVEVSVEIMAPLAADESTLPASEPEGPYFLKDQPHGLPAWPRPATTGADGRFTIRGVGRGLRVHLAIDDPRFAPLNLEIETDASSAVKDLTMAVEPPRIITGRVTYADTGAPAVHAWISVSTHNPKFSAWAGDFETDAQGRFRANPRVGDQYSVTVFAPENEPYLTALDKFAWPKGALEKTIDLALPRGVHIRGRVVEEGSGKPIAGRGSTISPIPTRTRAPAPRTAERRQARTAPSRSGSCPARGIWPSSAPARTTCSARSAGAWPARASRAGGGCTPTPSIGWSWSRATTAGTSRSPCGRARPCRSGSSSRTAAPRGTPSRSAGSSSSRP